MLDILVSVSCKFKIKSILPKYVQYDEHIENLIHIFLVVSLNFVELL